MGSQWGTLQRYLTYLRHLESFQQIVWLCIRQGSPKNNATVAFYDKTQVQLRVKRFVQN